MPEVVQVFEAVVEWKNALNAARAKKLVIDELYEGAPQEVVDLWNAEQHLLAFTE